MTKNNLKELDIDALVQRFVEVAESLGRVTFELVSPLDMPGREEYEAQAKRLEAQLEAIDSELRTREPNARLKLLPLYSHPSLQVQLSAATSTLAVTPALARAKLEDIAKINWIEGTLARSTLHALDNGNFKPE